MKSRRAAFALILSTLALSGCMNAMLTKAIVQAPNQRDTAWLLRPENAGLLDHFDRTYAVAWKTHVASPSADIAVAVINPGDYHLVHAVKSAPLPSGKSRFWPQSDWKEPPEALPGGGEPKATILILHGFQDTKENMIHWALFLAQAGYRVVLVDLRGHGRSSGDWIGYGAFEANDLTQVLDDVERRGLLAGPLGVLGLSYGGSVALEFAAHDARVAAVVALEPFSDPRQAVVDFAHGAVPGLVRHWSPQDFAEAEDEAGQMAHLNWSQADVLGSVAALAAPVLYVHPVNDHWVDPASTGRLAEHTKGPHGVMTVTFTGITLEPHVLLSWVLDPIAEPVRRWLDESLLRPGPDLPARLDRILHVSDETKENSPPSAQAVPAPSVEDPKR